MRMSETRKEVFADNFSCSALASDNSCSSFSTFASASILCVNTILMRLHISPQNASHLFENVFLDFDEWCFLVGALGSFDKLIRGFSDCVACHFQSFHALGTRFRLRLINRS